MASDRPRFEDELRARVPWGVWRGITYFQIEEAEQDALADAVEALRYMAEYQLTGTEQTLHIDFQGKAREALTRLDGEQ